MGLLPPIFTQPWITPINLHRLTLPVLVRFWINFIETLIQATSCKTSCWYLLLCGLFGRIFTLNLTITTFYLAMAMLVGTVWVWLVDSGGWWIWRSGSLGSDSSAALQALVLVPGTNLAFRQTARNPDGSLASRYWRHNRERGWSKWSAYHHNVWRHQTLTKRQCTEQIWDISMLANPISDCLTKRITSWHGIFNLLVSQFHSDPLPQHRQRLQGSEGPSSVTTLDFWKRFGGWQNNATTAGIARDQRVQSLSCKAFYRWTNGIVWFSLDFRHRFFWKKKTGCPGAQLYPLLSTARIMSESWRGCGDHSALNLTDGGQTWNCGAERRVKPLLLANPIASIQTSMCTVCFLHERHQFVL